jgi:hypothetical protein
VPFDSHKSFYNKAVLLDDDDTIMLRSYNTIVSYYKRSSGQLSIKGLYSMTTRRHIRAFIIYLQRANLIDDDIDISSKNLLKLYGAKAE